MSTGKLYATVERLLEGGIKQFLQVFKIQSIVTIMSHVSKSCDKFELLYSRVYRALKFIHNGAVSQKTKKSEVLSTNCVGLELKSLGVSII